MGLKAVTYNWSLLWTQKCIDLRLTVVVFRLTRTAVTWCHPVWAIYKVGIPSPWSHAVHFFGSGFDWRPCGQITGRVY